MSAISPFNTTNIGVFQPNQIGGLALWLDAADSSTVLTTGSNVTAWNDKSGNGCNATAFGTPTYVNYPVNNLSAIRFNGTSSYFSIPGNQLDIATEDFAIFAVVQYTVSATELPIIGKGTGVLATQQWRLAFGLGNTFSIVIFKNSLTVSSTATYTTAGWGLFSGVVYRATSIQSFINASGSSPGGTVSGTLTDTATNVEIGRGWASPNRFFNSDMGEILLYKGTITASQRQQIESYLAYKWNLQSSLPTTHPYYNSPYDTLGSLTNINQVAQFAYSTPPSDIRGLCLWLDAADTSRMTLVGSNISQYTDKSSNAIILSNATSSNQPTLILDSNNVPNMLFNGTSQFLVNSAVAASNLTLNNEVTIFFVHTPSNTTNSLICWANDSFSVRINFHTPEGSTGFKFDYRSASARVEVTVPNYLTSGRRLEGGYKRGTNQVIRTFGSNRASIVNTNTITGSTSLALTLGWFFNLAAYYYGGRFCELVWYNRGLNDSEIEQVESYLAWKWRLQGGLPITHPYYNNAFIPNMNVSIPTTVSIYQYSPRAISGLALWLDAADIPTVQLSPGTQNVTGWNDKSGNGFNASPTGNPTLIRSGRNGLNTVSLNGTSQYFSFANSNVLNFTTNDFAIFTTILIRSGSGVQTMFGKNVGAVPQVRFTVESGGVNLIIFNGSSQSVNIATNSIPSNWSLLNGIVYRNSGAFIYQDGNIAQSTSNTISGSLSSSAIARIGVQGGLNQFLNADIGEMIIYDTTLTTNQRQAVEGYLAWKWGLQSSLPANHPYKLFPPG